MACHNSNPLPTFPPDINRDFFGSWLSGFSDGEACFNIYRTKDAWFTKYIIALRDDDFEIVELIRLFLQCGHIRRKPKRGNTNQQVVFEVSKPRDLVKFVIPQFDKFPLQAKKKRDYAIWKPAVELVYKSCSRKRNMIGYRQKGRLQKRTDQEIAEFDSYVSAIRLQREYSSKEIIVDHHEPLNEVLLF